MVGKGGRGEERNKKKGREENIESLGKGARYRFNR
jgi:hypothetical protein